MVGPDALAVVRPTVVYLLDFFCSGIQFYVLLSHYLCYYILIDDALIRLGLFIATKHLCVLIHILTKGEVGAMKPV